jgi:hypothetical protein
MSRWKRREVRYTRVLSEVEMISLGLILSDRSETGVGLDWAGAYVIALKKMGDSAIPSITLLFFKGFVD